MEWVAAHPERDADREATSWSDAERANVRADAAAEAAHTSEVDFDWDEPCMLRAGGGMWALADTTILEAPVPRHAWQRRSRELGMEYARERLKQEGLERQGWATAIWAGVKERDWGVTTFRTRLWWGHLLPYKARHTGWCNLCGEAVAEMQWHILACCQHPKLLVARLEAADIVRVRFVSGARELNLPADLRGEVFERLGGRANSWVRADRSKSQ